LYYSLGFLISFINNLKKKVSLKVLFGTLERCEGNYKEASIKVASFVTETYVLDPLNIKQEC